MNKTYMDKVEKFIVQNRNLLDSDNVPEAVWDKIQLPRTGKNITTKANLKPLYKWGIAAALTGIIFSGIYLAMPKTNRTANNKNIENSITTTIESPEKNSSNSLPVDDIKNIAPKYTSEVDKIYKSIVLKQNELKNVAGLNPELYRQFASDLAILDSSYRVLKSQADSSPNHDVIIKAMIQNIQLQAELLSRQLSIIHQFKNLKNENDETPNNKRNI